MRTIFTDMGALSINNPNASHETENGRSSTWDNHFPNFTSYDKCTPRSSSSSLEEYSHMIHTTNHVGDDQVKGSHEYSSSASDGFGEFNINHETNNIDLNNEENGKLETTDSSCGQSKLCSRGHWRPAEDSKLKELVALYGPQNWNLIADKLQGRSGIINLIITT